MWWNKMKVVVLKENENLGEVDSIINVAAGYARNYLLPRKMVAVATKSVVAAAEERRAKKEAEMEAKRSELEALAKELDAAEVSIEKDAGETGKLFGSVSSQEIAELIKTSLKHDINKRKIHLLSPIKTTGEHVAEIKIFKDIQARLKVKVVAKPHAENQDKPAA